MTGAERKSLNKSIELLSAVLRLMKEKAPEAFEESIEELKQREWEDTNETELRDI